MNNTDGNILTWTATPVGWCRSCGWWRGGRGCWGWSFIWINWEHSIVIYKPDVLQSTTYDHISSYARLQSPVILTVYCVIFCSSWARKVALGVIKLGCGRWQKITTPAFLSGTEEHDRLSHVSTLLLAVTVGIEDACAVEFRTTVRAITTFLCRCGELSTLKFSEVWARRRICDIQQTSSCDKESD